MEALPTGVFLNKKKFLSIIFNLFSFLANNKNTSNFRQKIRSVKNAETNKEGFFERFFLFFRNTGLLEKKIY